MPSSRHRPGHGHKYPYVYSMANNLQLVMRYWILAFLLAATCCPFLQLSSTTTTVDASPSMTTAIGTSTSTSTANLYASDEHTACFPLGRFAWGHQRRRQSKPSNMHSTSNLHSATSSKPSNMHSATSTTASATHMAVSLVASTTVAPAPTHTPKMTPPSPLIQIWQKLRKTPGKLLPRRLGSPNHASRAETTTTSSTASSSTTLSWQALGRPIFDQDTWEQQTGREFVERDELRQALVQAGLEALVTNDYENPWIRWKLHTHIPDTNNKDESTSAYDTSIEVYKGTALVDGYGAIAPWILTRAIVPLSPRAFVELMMDSNRVKTYNAWSTGREDLWEAPPVEKESTKNDNRTNGWTKIVRNTSQPPLGPPLVSTTLLHAQQLESPDANTNHSNRWILVSRAVAGSHFAAPASGGGTSEILLGVNLCEAVPGRPNYSRVTALTHVNSSTNVPLMMAEKFAVKSAIQFFKSLRTL